MIGDELDRLRKAVGEQTESARKWKNRASNWRRIAKRNERIVVWLRAVRDPTYEWAEWDSIEGCCRFCGHQILFEDDRHSDECPWWWAQQDGTE